MFYLPDQLDDDSEFPSEGPKKKVRKLSMDWSATLLLYGLLGFVVLICFL